MARNTIKTRVALDGGREIEGQLKALGEAGEKAFDKIRQAAVKADLAKFGDSLNKFSTDLATVGRRVALGFSAVATGAGAAGLAMLNLAKGGAAAADEAGKSAQKAGLQIDAYGKLAFAAEMADVSQEQFIAGMARLNKELGAAAGGNDKAADKFKALGVSIFDARGKLKPTQTIIEDLARVFARMPDGARKSALAMELFGKSGANLLPFLNQGADGIRELAKSAEELGIVFTPEQFAIGDALGDALDEVSKAIKGLKIQLGLLFAPSLTLAATAFRNMIVENKRQILDFADKGVKQATVLIRDLVAALAGNDAAVQNVWILEWRDAIIQFGRDFLSVVDGAVIPAFETLHAVAGKVTEAVNAIFGTGFSGGELLILAAIAQVLGGFKLLTSAIGVAIAAARLLFGLAMANPWVAAITVVAGGILLWATRADAATSAMEQHRGTVDTVRDAYARAGGEVAKMSQEVKDRLFVETTDAMNKMKEAISSTFDSAAGQLFVARQNEVFGELIQKFIDGKLAAEDLIDQVSAIGRAQPELAGVAQEITNVVKPLEELTKKQTFNTDFLDLLSGKLSDAEFQAKQAGEGLTGWGDAAKKAGDAAKAGAEGVGTAVKQAGAEIDNLRTITVTSFGSDGPVKKIFDVSAEGVAKVRDGVSELSGKMSEADLSARTAAGTLDQLTEAGGRSKQRMQELGSSVVTVGEQIKLTSEQLAAQAAQFNAAVPFETMAQGLQEISVATQDVATKVAESATTAATSLQEIGTSAQTVAAEAAAGTAVVAESIKQPFEQLPPAISTIMAGIRSPVQLGFESIMSLARGLTGEIQQMINGILAALRQAAAEAARLRSQASGSSSSSSRSTTTGFATGGSVRGPGTARSDSILARLSNGEFVIQAAAVRKFGVGFFDMLNRGLVPAFKGFSVGGVVDGLNRSLAIPRFATGGPVDFAMASAGGVSGRPLTLVMPGGESFAVVAPENVAQKIQRFAAGKAMVSAGRKPGWNK